MKLTLFTLCLASLAALLFAPVSTAFAGTTLFATAFALIAQFDYGREIRPLPCPVASVRTRERLPLAA